MPVASIVTAEGVVFVFDACSSVRLNGSSTVTVHPVEEGGDIADHAQRQPRTLSLVGIVTETPRTISGEAGGPDRPLRALEFLDGLADAAPVAIVTEKLGTFLNMKITRCNTGIDRVRRLAFDVEFAQVRIVTAVSVAVAPTTPAQTTASGDEDPAAAGLPDATDSGEQPTTATDEPEAEAVDTSWLLDLATATGTAP